MDTLTTATANRACLQNLFKSNSTLCQHMELVHAQFIGGSDAPCFDSDDPEDFRLFLGCPTDAIAYYLDMHMRKGIAALRRSIPAVEIWIEGPEYGVVLSLSKIKMLDLGRNIITGESMISSTIERNNEVVTTGAIEAGTPFEQIAEKPVTRDIIKLDRFAKRISQSEAETIKMLGQMSLPLFPQPDGSLGINKEDTYLLVMHWVEKEVDNDATPVVPTSTEPTPIAKTRRGGRAKTVSSENPVENQASGLIQWKTKPNQSSIKDTAEETLTVILKKITSHNKLQICQALVKENEVGLELMNLIHQLFKKKHSNGNANLFLNNLKAAARKTLEAMGLEIEPATA